MITVMKASAGSGKTYALAKKYTDMLLGSTDPHEYRQILAVTFTNKATDEMKARIVKMLYESGNPRAREILSDILHDYSSFAVSTIDTFFQRTLRAFARELGQFNRYQVELDKNALVDEAVDMILEELNADDPEDRKMIDFMVESLEDTISEGKGLDVEGSLKEMARHLKSEAFSRKCAELGMDREKAYQRDELSALKKVCRAELDAYQEFVRKSAKDIRDASLAIGLDLDEYGGKWLTFLTKYFEWDCHDKFELSESQMRKITAATPAEWFNKADQYKFESAYAAIGDKLLRFASLPQSEECKRFNTARILLDQVYGLGVAARLFKSFKRIATERNVMCLDESNSLLRDIIDGSDAPFVYEKTGVRFKTFLLDEFQDTSSTQWQNFLPLLQQSESEKPHKTEDHRYDNLIVGDVKQSIYRWRDGDWSLLDHQVEEAFPDEIFDDPLNHNWRSLNNIVDFNNALYPKLAELLDAEVKAPEGMHSISDIYSGTFQHLGKAEEQMGGVVQVQMEDDAQGQIENILQTVIDLRDNHNARLGDIAILVRTKVSGTQIAQHLIDNGISVVTDASLRVKNSISVRRLVSMMSYVDNPDDTIGSYIASEFGIKALPESYHSIADLVEQLYKILCNDPGRLDDCRKEVMYVASFMDFVTDYCNSNGNNLREFLSYWAQKDPDVNASSSSDSVRIVTIHKSKGLDFEYVIVPFVENIMTFNNDKTRLWTSPRRSGSLDPYADWLFHVKLTDKSDTTLFEETYRQERFNQAVDAMNLLYVATTRARSGMKILFSPPSKKNKYNLAIYLTELFKGADGNVNYTVGNMPDFSLCRKDESNQNTVNMNFPFYEIGSRLGIRPYAADFFSREDNALEHLSFRERGVVLHDILSRIVTPEDLEHAVDVAVDNGELAADSKAKVMDFLGKRIASHPDFFPAEDSGITTLAEQTVIDSDGTDHRPDRVLIYPDGRVLIVDYKFGSPKDEYVSQIVCYKKIFEKMGYASVRAVLWFVYGDFIVE